MLVDLQSLSSRELQNNGHQMSGRISKILDISGNGRVLSKNPHFSNDVERAGGKAFTAAGTAGLILRKSGHCPISNA
jgi:hypothetical protein